MFVARKQETPLEAQSGALYAPQHPFLQRVAFGNGMHETTHSMSFMPKETDWACLLRENKKHLQKRKVVHCMHTYNRFRNGYPSATESHETTKSMSFTTNEVD
jgi:hypothetical protein